MYASLIKSSKMMFDLGGPNQGTSKRGSFSSGSSSGRSYGGFRVVVNSSGGSNKSGSSGPHYGISATRGSGIQL
ncbi:unnamed protein product [Prunus brigantina]